MKVNSTEWWHSCSAIWRFMPGEDKKTIANISQDLHWLSNAGFQAIQITAPYESAGFHPWWGLRVYDYFSINQDLKGTREDFVELVKKCHRFNLKVLLFLNLGYADVTTPYWKIACQEKSRLFLWSDSPDTKLTQEPGTHFKQGGYWQWSEEANSYYWCNWNEMGFAEPQYNWENPEVRYLIREILEYWLSMGVDGIIVDAVNWYLNCDMNCIRENITDIIHEYPEVCCIPEGGTGFQDDFGPWLREAKFDIIEDQMFHSDWNGSYILGALEAEDPSLIDQGLQQLHEVKEQGTVCWSYLSYGEKWTPSYRLMEIATLIVTGHMTEILSAYLHHFEKEQWDKFHEILAMTKNGALAPCVQRERIYPEGGEKCYVVKCLGEEEVICILNFSKEEQKIVLPGENEERTVQGLDVKIIRKK